METRTFKKYLKNLNVQTFLDIVLKIIKHFFSSYW